VLVESFPVPLGVLVGVVVAAVCAAFALSAPIDRTMLAPAPRHVTVVQARRVFGDYGIGLHYTSRPAPHVTVLSVMPPPYAPTSLTVSISSGLLSAQYGGRNERVRARFDAAVAALSR
jgi:hypothetical protein